MPRKKRIIVADKSTQRKAADNHLKCLDCPKWFSSVHKYRKHIKKHAREKQKPPPSPPTKLLSRRSTDTSVGVYDFCSIIEEEDDVSFDAGHDDSDADSYFSDGGLECENESDDNERDANNQEAQDGSSNDSDVDADDDDDDYDEDNEDDEDDGDDDDDDHAAEGGDLLIDDLPYPYFTPPIVDEGDIPFSDDIFSPIHNCSPPSHFVTQSCSEWVARYDALPIVGEEGKLVLIVVHCTYL